MDVKKNECYKVFFQRSTIQIEVIFPNTTPKTTLTKFKCRQCAKKNLYECSICLFGEILFSAVLAMDCMWIKVNQMNPKISKFRNTIEEISLCIK